jgi:hypothetical protein
MYFPSTIELLIARFRLHGHRGISSHRQVVCHSSGSDPGMARHGELFPVPQAVHQLDRVFQVWIFRRQRIRQTPTKSRYLWQNESRLTPSPELKATFASMSKWTTMRSAMHGLLAPCGAASRTFSRPRPTRCLAVHPALLRRVHHGACHGQRARGGRRLEARVPLNAQYIRNLILIAHALHDHIVHFYQLSALDWVDILQIPKADPARRPSWRRAFRPGRATPAMSSKPRRTA